MAGLSRNTPRPTEIKLHQQSKLLEVIFEDGMIFQFSFEFLRVYSPSAEVRGHGPDQEILQTGKQDVIINHVDPVGNYAVQLSFSDGHSTGLYSWDLLYEYGIHQKDMWQHYLQRIDETGESRTRS